jgi:hypothetical protein
MSWEPFFLFVFFLFFGSSSSNKPSAGIVSTSLRLVTERIHFKDVRLYFETERTKGEKIKQKRTQALQTFKRSAFY